MEDVMKYALVRGLLLVSLLLLAGRPALAVETIGWEGLVPEVDESLDPYKRLTGEQQDNLYDLWMLHKLSEEITLEDSLADKLQAAEASFEADGIDPDAILGELEAFLALLEANNNRLVQDLDGKDVRIPGYVLPTEFSGSKVVEFLLVPYVGACVHTPAPPANQMVHVKVDEGFTSEGLFAPVWVTGQINTAMSTQSVSFNDGAMDVEAGYRIEASAVIPYE
jgi:hypothetical protein